MTEKLYLPPVLQIIRENTVKWGNPLGLSAKDCSAWARGLQIPDTGKTILYTGCEYQMTSQIRPLLELVKKVKFEDTALSALKGIQSATRSIGLDVAKLYARFGRADAKAYNRNLQMAALVLKRLGVDFAYLNDELYSGALLYENGFFEDFAKQAERVMAQFRQAGITKVIALTPHSAEIFQKIYPQFVSNFNIEVVPYVCVVAEALKRSGRELSLLKPLMLTYQDPCHLARALGVTSEPREILHAMKNLDFREVTPNRELTMCCGAPCEIIYPELSEQVACRRVEDFLATGVEAVATLCPFCYASFTNAVRLKKQGLAVIDFIEIVYQALGIENGRG